MKKLIILLCLLATPAYAQSPRTYTLSPQQQATLQAALSAAQFWYVVRATSVQNTLDERAFRLAIDDLVVLRDTIATQDRTADEALKKK